MAQYFHEMSENWGLAASGFRSLAGTIALVAVIAFAGFGTYLMTQGQDLGSQINHAFSLRAAELSQS